MATFPSRLTLPPVPSYKGSLADVMALTLNEGVGEGADSSWFIETFPNKFKILR